MYLTLHILGWVLSCLGGLWIIVLAWEKDVWWGAGCFLLPFVQWFYVGLHWKESKHAFMLQVSGLAVLVLAEMLRT